MAKIRYRIEVFQKIGGDYKWNYTYDSDPSVIITDGIAFDSDKSIEATSDSFSFRVMNKQTGSDTWLYKNNVKTDDRVRIYITTQEEITSDNKDDYLKFDGIISETNYATSVDGRILSVKGESRLRSLLNFAQPAFYQPQTDFTATASNIIQEIINGVNDENQNNQITWDSGNDSTSTEIQFFRNYRPAIEMITELSKQSINQEFNAYFYLSTDNEIVWKIKGKNSDTVKIIEGTDFINSRLINRVWEVLNAMIVDCGIDPSGRRIHAMFFDESSATQYGLKWHNTIEPKSEISSQLQAQQQALDGWIETSDATARNFPDSSSYPLTLSFEDRNNASGVPTGSQVVVTSDDGYGDAIRKEAKWQGIEYARAVISLTGFIRPKIDVTVKGGDWELGVNRTGSSSENMLNSLGNQITQGDFIKIIIPSRELSANNGDSDDGVGMRVVQINHMLSQRGWEVTIRLEVDIDDATTLDETGH